MEDNTRKCISVLDRMKSMDVSCFCYARDEVCSLDNFLLHGRSWLILLKSYRRILLYNKHVVLTVILATVTEHFLVQYMLMFSFWWTGGGKISSL